MKIVIAPDSFKGSLTSKQAAKAIERGVKKVDKSIETILIPMADGGEGTVQSLVDISKGEIFNCEVHDPIGRKITAHYGVLGDHKTAVIEMASASGLPLLSDAERNPLVNNTFGTGEIILNALDNGFKKIIIGLGGSSTNDGGAGMARALGVRFLDKENNQIIPLGGTLSNINHIDLSGIDKRLVEVDFIIACDVDNPLCGESGASYIYAPQKGASASDVEILEQNMCHYASLLNKQLGKNIKDTPGAGAAGGLGAGMMVFLNAKLKKGIEIVAEIANLKAHIKNADLVITGEGIIDFQTIYGKTPFGVAMIASKNNVPTIAIAGSLGKDYQILYNNGFSGLFSIINKPMLLEEAINNAAILLENKTENIIRFWLEAKNVRKTRTIK